MSEEPQRMVKIPGRVDAFHREVGGAFSAHEKEQYAKARARGDNIKSAAAAAGITAVTATSYEKNEAMRKRISQLRQGAETFIGVSNAWIINQLMRNAEEARGEGAFKASNEAIGMIYKIMNEQRDLASQMARALPSDIEGRELKKMLSSAFKKPAMPAEKASFTLPPAPREEDEDEREDDEAGDGA